MMGSSDGGPASMGVVFDFDGTLVDTVDLLVDTARFVLHSAGFEEAAMADLEALRDIHPLRALEAVHIPIRAIPGLARRLRRELRRKAHEVEIAHDVSEVIRRLHQSGFTLGVMSSNSPSLIRSVLERAHVAHCFAFVARGGAIRDRASRLRRVVRRRNAAGKRWIFVGDEIRDVEAALICNITFVGVGWGATSPQGLTKAGARLIALSWSELEEILRTLRSNERHSDEGE